MLSPPPIAFCARVNDSGSRVAVVALPRCEKMVLSLHDGQKKNSKKAKDCKDNCRDKENN